ncbi:YitT family protein [Exiguobacterium algae]|uniref:YitT family protein n=1 Tax=Exiguobacterium algae TaxID=2751250 RepID=UPI001BEB7584|nr:YitT family protein [Exiguobacterium algae]
MKRVATIVLGTLIMAFGYCYLNEQFGLAEGGFVGLALLGRYLFDFDPALSMILLDFPFFIIALWWKGWRFVGQALLAASSLSLSYAMWERLEWLTFNVQVWPATLLAAVASGIVTGYGLGLVLKSGGVTGGDDLFALGLSKWTGMSVGTILIVLDVVVLGVSLIYLPLANALYTLVAVSIAGRVVTKMLVVDEPEATPVMPNWTPKNDLA